MYIYHMVLTVNSVAEKSAGATPTRAVEGTPIAADAGTGADVSAAMAAAVRSVNAVGLTTSRNAWLYCGAATRLLWQAFKGYFT